MRGINVSRTGDPVHVGDKALTRETPAKRGRVNRYDYNMQQPRFYILLHDYFISHQLFTRHYICFEGASK